MGRKLRVVGYVRVSQINGREGPRFIAPDDQRAEINRFVSSRGHELVAEVEDLDESGGTLDRAGLLRPRAGQAPPEVSLPVGFTTFPYEIFRAPRSWVEKSYPNLTYFNEVDKGGHFAAWEEPELFAAELRAAFGSLR